MTTKPNPTKMRDALSKLSMTHGYFRAAHNALLAGLPDFAALTAREGFEAAAEACEALDLLGDHKNGMRQLNKDMSDHAMRPAGKLAEAVEAQHAAIKRAAEGVRLP